MLCDDCELKCRSSDECGMYQDLEGDVESLKNRIKWLENNREFLLEEIYRKDAMLERLK
jgi:chaperonin cofactor prefoldin